MKKILFTLLFFVLFSLGISLQVKANIDLSTFNAFCLSVSKYLHLSVGLMINVCNMIIFVLYTLIKKSIHLLDLLQFVFIIINGLLVDLFLQKLFLDWEIENYGMTSVIFLIGLLIAALSLGQILRIGLVKFPLESLCIELEKKTTFTFGAIRYAFDFIFLIGVIAIFIVDHHILTIREGTVISFFLLSYLVSVSYRWSLE
ncbi:hypothetical protein [Staphylococcus intermedius]|uniref:Uncharacterized BCR, YitT family COG1284 n=1 Tax=Staphylococcus intermedius NCTC 11048 TaxID=1141106 RepID=A0A380G475_STAIN|nr:hypothetical protein [Staphylococcus intermedius]PCF63853.1 hypothetical protein B5C04_07685 [Staphylococcus intermedius]PCF78568.1 hypothetical protein B4W74_08035 [Staphylococcus intermedius]PCF79541.1 hypothetical protein B4W70_07675 [Staphylococcus intermedius]PCF86724.1 hypothetical protein B4W76_06630 [Staphylococcus intermedius]PCF89801.1 hypothetical protein B4W75_02870 [Staphylococcus intermedius]